MRSVESLSCDFLQDMSLNLCSDYKTAVCNITLYFPQTVTKCKSHLIFTMDPRKTKNRFPFIPPTPGYPPTSIPGYNGQSSTTIPVQSQSILPPVEKDAALQLDLVPALPLHHWHQLYIHHPRPSLWKETKLLHTSGYLLLQTLMRAALLDLLSVGPMAVLSLSRILSTPRMVSLPLSLTQKCGTTSTMLEMR